MFRRPTWSSNRFDSLHQVLFLSHISMRRLGCITVVEVAVIASKPHPQLNIPKVNASRVPDVCKSAEKKENAGNEARESSVRMSRPKFGRVQRRAGEQHSIWEDTWHVTVSGNVSCMRRPVTFRWRPRERSQQNLKRIGFHRAGENCKGW